MRKTVLFISTMVSNPFGGSEELWTRAAVLLAKQGMRVVASVHGWPQVDQRISNLARAGVDLHFRPIKPSILRRVLRYASGKEPIVFDVEKTVGKSSPSLVVISNGYVLPPVELPEICVAKNWPYVTVAQCNFTGWWVPDEAAARFRSVLPLARRCFFLSKENQAQAERQLGYDIGNAEIVWNPLVAETRSPIPWPHRNEEQLRMACVATLFPGHKGQDLLLDVLASPCWRDRNCQLTFYGSGPNRDVLARLVGRLKLEDRVSFGGYTSVEKIWETNHVLVMPSRFEGGPMTTVEAMWCGRPVVATNVGLNPELITDGATGFLAEAPTVEALANALERMWMQRERLEEIGKLAAVSIRKVIPDDPVGVFAEKLKGLAAT